MAYWRTPLRLSREPCGKLKSGCAPSKQNLYARVLQRQHGFVSLDSSTMQYLGCQRQYHGTMLGMHNQGPSPSMAAWKWGSMPAVQHLLHMTGEHPNDVDANDLHNPMQVVRRTMRR